MPVIYDYSERGERDYVAGLEVLSKIAAENHPGFFDMAADRDQWKDKVRISADSFSDKIKNKMDAKYIFVAEDLTAKKLVGLSMISAQHGTPDVPHFYFEVGKRENTAKQSRPGLSMAR